MSRIYVVIPRTIDSDKPPFKLCMSCGRMAAHAAHVGGLLEKESGVGVADLDLIVLAVGSSGDLTEICQKLSAANIQYVEYYDEDKCFEGSLRTCIATYPVEKDQVPMLAPLKPWRCKCNET